MNGTNSIIKTPEQAQDAVYKWCIKEGLESARFTEITAELSKRLSSGPVFESALINYIAHFVISTKQSEQWWERHSRDAWAANSSWAIETVKHLAFVSGAGLAGATALLGSTNRFSNNALFAATALFGIALILALLCMWLESTGYMKRAVDLDERVKSIRAATTWKAYADAHGKEYKDAGSRWFKISLFVGWGSAITAFLGVIFIVLAVVC